MIARGNAGFNPAVDLVFKPTNRTLADLNAFRERSRRHAFINSAAALSAPTLDFSTPDNSFGHARTVCDTPAYSGTYKDRCG
jgi:hypothetical protein